MSETYYEVLGVDPDASDERIETAYRERVLETHPDRNDEPDAAEAFKRVCDAEAVLGDPAERARYDRLGHAAYCRLGSIVDETASADGRDGGERDAGSRHSSDESAASSDESTTSSGRSRDESATSSDESATSSDESATSSDESATSRNDAANRSDRTAHARSGSADSNRADAKGGKTAHHGRNDERRRRSHHARQRARRRRRTAQYVRESFAAGEDAAGATTSNRTSASADGTAADAHESSGDEWRTSRHGWESERRRRHRRSTPDWSDGATPAGGRANAAPSGGNANGDSSARTADFAVHDWTDDVDLTPTYRDLDGQTLVTIGCLVLLYPVLVVASISPALPVVVNATVAGCTLLLIGYLLTIPRIAIATFGTWSLVVPLVLYAYGPVAPTAGLGLVALGACVTPLGYAVAVWWALRP